MNLFLDKDYTTYIESYTRRVEMEIDHSKFLSFVSNLKYTTHEVMGTNDLSQRYKNVNQNGAVFTWQFKSNKHQYKEYKVKFTSLDNVFGDVGGILEVITFLFGMFLLPIAEINFIVTNQSKKEEIDLVIG